MGSRGMGEARKRYGWGSVGMGEARPGMDVAKLGWTRPTAKGGSYSFWMGEASRKEWEYGSMRMGEARTGCGLGMGESRTGMVVA
jgi:hypothetical protein